MDPAMMLQLKIQQVK